MNNLFGIPFFKTTIDPNKFNKNEIIQTITENYRVNNCRNNIFTDSFIHHEFNDRDNSNFKKINYTELIPIYSEEIKNFLNQFKFNCVVKYNFEIVNYTCVNQIGQFMETHLHSGCDFVATHYLSFDPKVHKSTEFRNPLALGSYGRIILKQFYKCLDKNVSSQMDWLEPNVLLSVSENDLVIAPSFIEHNVPVVTQNTEKLRIVIVANISIEEDVDL